MTISTRNGRPPRALDAAFGKEHWDARTAQIMREHNASWPASQPADPARLPRT